MQLKTEEPSVGKNLNQGYHEACDQVRSAWTRQEELERLLVAYLMQQRLVSLVQGR